ncbi:MAG TPA: hypothetical protein VFR06_07390 [Gallionellaceae bacterium]|nr:hypothetical protein [Gallionellaceae bacterium]
MKEKKPLRVPVTEGLKNIYAMDMRMAYQAAVSGQFNEMAFGRLAAAISVVRTALEQRPNISPEAKGVLDLAIAALMLVRMRGDSSDVWEITESERPDVLHGIDIAEQCIGMLDVALLEQTAAQLLQTMTGN